MAVWWATEAIPVAVTALLPLALFPLMDVTSFESAAVPYANKNIYLFLGGFILALGIENSGLHKRIALKMILAVGSSGARLVGGFMLVSALNKHVGYEYFNNLNAFTNWFGCMRSNGRYHSWVNR